MSQLIDENSTKRRDPYKIKRLFSNINELVRDPYWDFRFFKDLETPKFAITLLERALTDDEMVLRYDLFRKQEIQMNTNDIIGSTFDW